MNKIIADAALIDEVAKVIFNPFLAEWGEQGDKIWRSCKMHRDDIPHTFYTAKAVLKRLGYEVIESEMKDTLHATECPACGHRTKLTDRGYACRQITDFANCSSNCEYCTCKNEWHYPKSATVATEDVAPMSMDEGVILLGAFSEYIKSKYIMCSDDLRCDMRDAFIAGAEWQRKYGG